MPDSFKMPRTSRDLSKVRVIYRHRGTGEPVEYLNRSSGAKLEDCAHFRQACVDGNVPINVTRQELIAVMRSLSEAYDFELVGWPSERCPEQSVFRLE